jgi:hypothetical protein
VSISRGSKYAAAGVLMLLSAAASARQTPTMTSTRAQGTFDVTIKPQPADDYTDGASMGRMTVDKQYHGDLAGTAKAQMLTGMSSSVKESGVYVAVERITGTLQGKKGSFMLHHTGVMTRGAPSLAVTIVPDSGTEQLAGIAGSMTIDIATDGTHSYTLQYTIAPKP